VPFAIHYRAKFSLSEVELQDGYVYRGIFTTHASALPGAHLWRSRMPESMTASQLVRDEEDDSTSNRPSKKRGNLSETLDRELEARLPPGQPGRPKGTTNYEWTPETDKLLVELCERSGTTKAKRLVGRRIQEDRPAGAAPRPDSVRKAVERRMAKLGICAGQKRSKPDTREVKPWTECQTKTLLGALGADANIKSIAIRTGHSVKSVRAKIARLDYQVDEIPGATVYTADTLAAVLHVTPRQVRRWRQRGWLGTKDRRITGQCVKEFLRAHPDRIAFDSLPRVDQVCLIDLGYPSPDAAEFKKSVREILDGIGRQRKPRRPVHKNDTPATEAGREEEDTDDDDQSTLTSGASI